MLLTNTCWNNVLILKIKTGLPTPYRGFHCFFFIILPTELINKEKPRQLLKLIKNKEKKGLKLIEFSKVTRFFMKTPYLRLAVGRVVKSAVIDGKLDRHTVAI